MWLQGFCGCARVSSNYTVWWNVADRICTRIHTLVAFYDGNQTDGLHYRFALPQTFWQIFFCFFSSLVALSKTFFGDVRLTDQPSKTLNLILECVLNVFYRWNNFLAQSLVWYLSSSLVSRVLFTGDAPAKAINILWRKSEREREWITKNKIRKRR